MHSKFQDLALNNAFLFAAALEDSDVCRIILEMLLEIPIGHVTVHAEHSMLFSSDFCSIRLDVYASNESQTEYNLEMQNENEGNLTKRSRFHQAEMDVMTLKPGENFDRLPAGYVIFICTFDPFGLGLYRYTFENICREHNFPLNDGATKIFLNTMGTKAEDVPDALVNFLHYIENTTDSYVDSLNDRTIHKIHERIIQVKKSRKWEGRYMKFQELLQNAEQKGVETGQQQILELTNRMIQAGETNQLSRLLEDHVFLQTMLKKYHLI